jgi:hypothetical protein
MCVAAAAATDLSSGMRVSACAKFTRRDVSSARSIASFDAMAAPMATPLSWRRCRH